MSAFDDPFDPKVSLPSSGCGCGRHASQAEHDASVAATEDRIVEQAVMRALFPRDELRRRFLRTVGAGTALSAVSTFFPLAAPTIENINGQAITLAVKHKDKRDPKQWKGFKFAVPFDYSMHNYLLRYYVAEHGLDPDRDIQIRAVPPPEMVANLRADNIDGF